jgi:hypothetical protein
MQTLKSWMLTLLLPLLCACAVLQTDEFAVRADDALISWAAKQKLYFNDLLSPHAAAIVAALLEGQQPAAAADAAGAAAVAGAAPAGRESGAAGVGVGVLPLAERKGLVDMLRQLSSVVQPDRWVQ